MPEQMNNLSRNDICTLMDGLDLLLGSYGPDIVERVKMTYRFGSEERKRVHRLINLLHEQLLTTNDAP